VKVFRDGVLIAAVFVHCAVLIGTCDKLRDIDLELHGIKAVLESRMPIGGKSCE
jgi:hypothetical protein